MNLSWEKGMNFWFVLQPFLSESGCEKVTIIDHFSRPAPLLLHTSFRNTSESKHNQLQHNTKQCSFHTAFRTYTLTRYFCFQFASPLFLVEQCIRYTTQF